MRGSHLQVRVSKYRDLTWRLLVFWQIGSTVFFNIQNLDINVLLLINVLVIDMFLETLTMSWICMKKESHFICILDEAHLRKQCTWDI